MFNFDKEDICIMICGYAVVIILVTILGAVTHTL